MDRAIKVAIVATIVGTTATALGWGATGHFYTATAVLEHQATQSAASVRSTDVLTAFCTYVPDLSRELDAQTVSIEGHFSMYGAGLVTWGVLDRCWGAPVRRMVAVQYYLHALTGTDSQSVTRAAKDTLKTLLGQLAAQPTDATLACALGFAIHLLGDSYAHRTLKNEDQMYETGLGHLRDGHDPDEPLSSPQRYNVWRRYVQDLTDAVGHRGLKPDVGDLLGLGKKLLPRVSESAWDDYRLRSDIERSMAHGTDAVWLPFRPRVEAMERQRATQQLAPSCDDTLEYFARGIAPAGLSCKRVWLAFAAAAKLAFRKLTPPCEGIGEVFP